MRAKLLALVIGLFLLTSASFLQAQTKVAVLDMGAVFDAHPTFKQKVEALKAEVTQYEQSHQAQRESLVEDAKRLQGMDAANPLYREDESRIANMTAELEVQKRLKAKEFAQKEAAIYFEIYRDVSSRVKNYCEQKGIGTVVHFNSKEMTIKDPSTIMARMNSNVIFYRPMANITDDVIQLCGGQVRPVGYQAPTGNQNP